ncbi:MAG: dienelactone hydrolase family protein [Burkholderiales bacterium]|nr:dienelactone hydrolase family protein [Burkholderiales bacterium]
MASEAMVRVAADDGFSFDAFEVSADGTSTGGVVIVQEIFGLTDQLKAVARFLAREGFDAIVPSLMDRASPGTVVPFDQPDRGRELMMSIPTEKIVRDIAAAARRIDRGRGASLVGFCLGGGLALRAASEVPLTSAVSYYGTRLGMFLEKSPKCPMLFHFGATDSHSPPELIEQVKKAIPAAETHIYQAGHAFANDARTTYVKEAAETADARTLAFLRQMHRK